MQIFLILIFLCSVLAKKIGIAIITDQLHRLKYKTSIDTVRTYGTINNIPVMVRDISPKCRGHFFFQKHCTVRTILMSKTINYLLVLDADNYIVNTSKRIESYIHPNQDIIFSIRFHNNEIVAGNYIVKNTAWSLNFLQDWMLSENNYRGYNFDNGALHWLLLNRLSKKNDPCRSYIEPTSLQKYDQFVKCFHLKLKETKCKDMDWNHIKILPRWKSFFIDGWLTNEKWSEESFILHGRKDNLEPIKSNSIPFTKWKNMLLTSAQKQQLERDTGWDELSCVQNGQQISDSKLYTQRNFSLQ